MGAGAVILSYMRLGMKLKKINGEVYYSADKVMMLGKKDILLFKDIAGSNRPKKARLCTHKDADDRLHEMFIIFGRNTYIRPHKHPNKSVSYHIVEGSADVVLFDEKGKIVEVIDMGSYNSGKIFYFRIFEQYYYTPIPKSDFIVFHETTNGPFDTAHTVFAPWAPDDKNKGASVEFMKDLMKSAKRFLQNKNK